jgi:hypothetical protein
MIEEKKAIVIKFALQCDGCERWFGTREDQPEPLSYDEQKQIELLARMHGWAEIKRRNTWLEKNRPSLWICSMCMHNNYIEKERIKQQ